MHHHSLSIKYHLSLVMTPLFNQYFYLRKIIVCKDVYEQGHYSSYGLIWEETNNMLSDGEGYDHLSVLQQISQYVLNLMAIYLYRS